MTTTNTTSTNDIQTELLKLNTLNKEYELTMTQYSQAINDYNQNIQYYKTNKSFYPLKGVVFWGTSNVDNGVVVEENECVNMCLNNDTCTGAVYNTSTNECWAKTGNGTLYTSSDPNYISLLPSSETLVNRLYVLNTKLLTIQQQKYEILNSIDMTATMNNQEELNQELMETTQQLQQQNAILQEMTTNSNLYKKQYKDTLYIAKSQNIKYIILLIIMFFIISLFFVIK